MKSINVRLFAVLLTITGLIAMVTGCSNSPVSENTKVTELKVGVLPLVSALPLFMAHYEGFFEEEGLDVELVVFNSALEQDAALQAKELDGYFSDPINTLVMINGGVDISIVNTPYAADKKDRMFAIVSSPQSQINSVEDLKGVDVGISYATIIEYLQDKMMESAGFTESEISGQEIKQIPIRLQLLLSGEIEAALLPETLVSLVEFNGGKVIVDDTGLAFSETVIALSNFLMTQDPTLKDRFNKAMEKAAQKINSDKELAKTVLLENVSVPEPVQVAYQIPDYPVNLVPSEQEIDDIQTWLIQKDVLTTKFSYGKLVK